MGDRNRCPIAFRSFKNWASSSGRTASQFRVAVAATLEGLERSRPRFAGARE